MDQYFSLISHSLNTLSDGNLLALAVLLGIVAIGEAGIAFPFLVQGILIFLGQRIATDPTPSMILVGVVLIGGRLIGAAGIYWLSRHTGSHIINWLKKRLPAAHKADEVRARLEKRTFFAIVIARLTPGFLVPSSVASGSMKLPYGWFSMGVIVSAVAWDSFFVGAGALIGNNAQHVVVAVYNWVTIAAMVCISFALVKTLVSRLHRSRSTTGRGFIGLSFRGRGQSPVPETPALDSGFRRDSSSSIAETPQA